MYNYDEFRKWAKFIIGESFDDKWSYYQTLLKVSDKIKESIDSPSSSGTTEPTSATGEDGDIYVQTDTNGIVAVWFKVGDNWEASPFAIVSANPSGDATSELTKLEVDGTVYSVSNIEANPSEEATSDLSKLGVNGTVFNVSDVKANPVGVPTDVLNSLQVGGVVYDVERNGMNAEIIPITGGDGTTSRTFTLPKTPKYVSIYWLEENGWSFNYSFVWGASRTYALGGNTNTSDRNEFARVSSITYGNDGKSFTLTGSNASGACNVELGSGLMFIDYGVASGAINELIYQGTGDTQTITLTKSLANYDYIYIKCGYSESGSDNYATAIIDTGNLIASINVTTPRQTFGIYNDAFYYYFYVTSLTEFTKHANTRLVIQEIYGIKL